MEDVRTFTLYFSTCSAQNCSAAKNVFVPLIFTRGENAQSLNLSRCKFGTTCISYTRVTKSIWYKHVEKHNYLQSYYFHKLHSLDKPNLKHISILIFLCSFLRFTEQRFEPRCQDQRQRRRVLLLGVGVGRAHAGDQGQCRHGVGKGRHLGSKN